MAAAAERSDTPGLAGLLKDIEALQSVVAGWDEQQRNTVEALQRAIDALHREAFARLIRLLKQEPAAAGRLREAASDEVIYAVLRHLELLKPSLDERLQQALDSVRPYLHEHGGDVELVAVEPPDTVVIRLTGACDGCPASGLTLSAGVEKAIREHCPEITTIRKARGEAGPRAVPVDFVSPFAAGEADGWREVAALADIPEGDLCTLEIDGRSLLLTRDGGRVHCYENACAHLGMPLEGGEVADGILTCPYHGFRYALATGECLTAPEVQLQAHGVRVVDGRVEVRLT